MLHPADIAILLGYVAFSVWSGMRSVKVASENLDEYFLAGRSLRGWQAGVSMAATQFAADTPLVVTGLVATAGVFSLWRLWIYAIAFLMMALVLGASWRRTRVLTDAELTELRYSGKSAAVLRGAKAVYFGLVFNCVVLAMVLLAATRITEPFLHWDAWLPSAVFEQIRTFVEGAGVPLTVSGAPCVDGVCVTGACMDARCVGAAEWVQTTNNVISLGVLILVTTFYSTTGGLRAVVRTDILQFALAMVSTAWLAVEVVSASGGMSAMLARLHEQFPSGTNAPSADELVAFTPDRAHDVGWAVLTVIAIQWIAQINADGSGYLAQRTLACRSDADARSAGVIFTLLQVVARSLFWLPIAVGLLVVFPPSGELAGSGYAARREATYVLGIAELLPPGVTGIMLAGLFGALASTLDTHLNWGSSYFTNDLYARFIAPNLLGGAPSRRALVWVARGCNALILLLALAVLPHLSSIQTAWRASLLLGAGVGVLLVLRWLWWRMNAVGELSALVASLVGAPLLLAFVENDAIRLLTMAACATTVGLVAALVTPPEPEGVLDRFYRRARPPGFWGPVAGGKVSADAERLRVNFGAALGASLSIFMVLVGIGSWLLESPAPAIVPNRTLWIALNLVVGIGLTPVWVRWARMGRISGG